MSSAVLKITAIAIWLTAYFCPCFAQADQLPRYFKSPVPTHWNSQRGYSPWKYATPRGIEIINNIKTHLTDSCAVALPCDGFTLTFRSSAGGVRKRSHSPWGFFISSPDSPAIWTIVEPLPESETSIHGSLRISVYSDSFDTPVETAVVSEGFDLYGGDNLWVLRKDGGTLRLGGGNRSISEILSAEIPSFSKTVRDNRTGTIGFTASPGARVLISDISLIPEASTITPEMTHWNDSEKLEKHLSKSRDRMEGYWAMGSRTLEESRLRMGGDYRLAIVAEGGRYFLIYLGGASTNSGMWRSGAIKGVLTPRGTDASYDVEWVDATGHVMSHDITAIAEGDDSITIHFPYQQSQLQLLKSLH